MGGRRWWPAAVLVAAVLVLVACKPIPRRPPAPPPSGIAACGQDAPATPASSTEYVAVVDTPAADAPEVRTFEAGSDAERTQKVVELEKAGDVIAVAPNTPVSAAVYEWDDPRFGATPLLQRRALDQLGFPVAWNTASGAGVRVAVIDTGVRGDHEDLRGRVTGGADFVDGGSGSCNPGGQTHGTHVAGILAASDNSVGGLGGAPGATVVPVRVLNSNGQGDTRGVALGVLWAADPTRGNADVISLSLGGDDNATMHAAIRYAVEHWGVTVVAAAGNADSGAPALSVPMYPGAYDEVIGVAALSTGTTTRAEFSRYGPHVDVSAPGTDIDSTYSVSARSYGSLSGTSMSTPFVSAVAALLKQKCPALMPAHVKTRIVNTADAFSSPEPVGPLLQADDAVAVPCA